MTALLAAFALLLPTVPGASSPAVTQQNIHTTICVPGYTATVRPPETVTEAEKRKALRASGYKDQRLADYEWDHLVALELGGAPNDPRNLWLEPKYNGQSQRGDKIENQLHRQVCAGTTTLLAAQTDIEVFKHLHG